MLKCQSRILKTYHKAKADPVWPFIQAATFEKIPDSIAEDLEVCGGNVSIDVSAVDEPDWGGTYATLEVKTTCTRCKTPYVGVARWDLQKVSDLVTEALERRQE